MNRATGTACELGVMACGKSITLIGESWDSALFTTPSALRSDQGFPGILWKQVLSISRGWCWEFETMTGYEARRLISGFVFDLSLRKSRVLFMMYTILQGCLVSTHSSNVFQGLFS
jgi:hypothetical protein